MITHAARLVQRVLSWQLLASLTTGGLVALLAPYLVLLGGTQAVFGSVTLSLGLIAGGLLAILYNFIRLRRYRYTLRALALESSATDAADLGDLSDEPARLVWAWVVPSVISMGLATTVWRPQVLDLPTGITLLLLGVVMVAAVSLPLFLLTRLNILSAIEQASPLAMRDVAEVAEQSGRLRQHVAHRLLAAVLTPVLFLALGAALIVNAHLRRRDELARQETAGAFVRASLESSPGLVPSAGLSAAIERASQLGFVAEVSGGEVAYHIERGRDGLLTLRTPLDAGGVSVTFRGSSVRALSENTLLITLFAVTLAAAAGLALGRALRLDLLDAARRVRLLGTEGNHSSPPQARVTTFAAVEELGSAIVDLAARFRKFARAQQLAIAAKERASNMRGLFFASVSHDLKSPLNAILGFSELVQRSTDITLAQAESLGVIQRRGRELLALIETILDAARVEAGQLRLVPEAIGLDELLEASLETGRYLGGDSEVEIITALPKERPIMLVDKIRMARAVGTFVGHAIRSAKGPFVRVHVVREQDRLRMDIEVSEAQLSRRKLAALLDPNRQPGVGEHRGLALGVRLSRAIVELHHGSVSVREQKPIGAYFSLTLPTLDTFRDVR